jgi:transcription elongation factor Elf1
MEYADHFRNGSNLGGASPEDNTELLADDPSIVTCPACDHEQDESECFLGRLGWLTHYRCRYCGMGFSIAPEVPNHG